MQTTIKKNATPKTNVTNVTTGGKSLPAVPVLQQKPKKQEEIPQLMAKPQNTPVSRFAIQAAARPADDSVKRTPFAMQMKEKEAQPQARPIIRFNPVQRKVNSTGIPDNLKTGIENLSGYDMSDVRVQYNSDKPAQLQAHAYAQGTDIHIGPGQERHLPHEAWHVVQQKQGRVQATMQMKNVGVNNNAGLEHEADVMGSAALERSNSVAQKMSENDLVQPFKNPLAKYDNHTISFFKTSAIVQRTVKEDIDAAKDDINNTDGYTGKVLNGLNEYTEKILYAESQQNSHLELPKEVGEMAKGMKAWGANYYNKAQAYLYEAQKVNDHTRVGQNESVWTLSRLGQDTDLEPDTQSLKIKSGTTGVRQAIELKTCTTENESNMAKLVQDGLAQLQKREKTGTFSSLLLTVHNDHPKNIYPYTSTDLSPDLTNTDAIENKLLVRINATGKGSDIKLPLEVRLEHKGRRYATVFFNS